MQRPYSEAEIEAALKQMDAVLEIPEAVLEVVARAMYDHDEAQLLQEYGEKRTPIPWEKAPAFDQKYWREKAREALRAVRLVQAPVHLCDTCAQSMCRRRRDIEDACEDPLFPAKAIVVECAAYVADKRVEEIMAGAR